jgi:catechol 2,3-dioxygenase-like lactoylglutathione lyase family enzyme
MPKSKARPRETSAAALASMNLVAFVPTTNPAKARSFFEGVLNLRFVSEDPFALVFDSHGVTVRIANVSSVKGFRPAPFTILGWEVPDVASSVRELSGRGVTFERYPGMEQDGAGVWSSPSGARVAWFKDPDGNVLSLTQY